jgi:glutamate carboxypeptidase
MARFSVGVITGPMVNCVSSSCDAQALSMAKKKQEDLDDGVADARLQGTQNGARSGRG